MRELAKRMHADSAEMAELATEHDDSGDWRKAGMRSCADWIVVRLGFDRYTAEALLRAGHATCVLPQVAEAFSAGELSLDKVRSLSTVATSEDQGLWVQRAREVSPPELARQCREAHNAVIIDAPERARAQRAQRGLRTWWDDLGMLRLTGALPPDGGALVRVALENIGRRLAAERSARPITPDPAEDPAAALRADALVMACDAALREGRGGDASRSPVQMHVHVDLGVLTGETPNGRCHVEDGPALSTAVARRLGCDASIVVLTERDGLPIDAGRAKPVISMPMRRAVQSRDRTCLVPGCAGPAHRTEVHHIWHWADGGPTERWNLGSLCGPDHDRHHDGVFFIRRTPEGDLRFETPDGRLMGMATGGAWKMPRGRAGPR
jgi:hypothetical protein